MQLFLDVIASTEVPVIVEHLGLSYGKINNLWFNVRYVTPGVIKISGYNSLCISKDSFLYNKDLPVSSFVRLELDKLLGD